MPRPPPPSVRLSTATVPPDGRTEGCCCCGGGECRAALLPCNACRCRRSSPRIRTRLQEWRRLPVLQYPTSPSLLSFPVYSDFTS